VNANVKDLPGRRQVQYGEDVLWTLFEKTSGGEAMWEENYTGGKCMQCDYGEKPPVIPRLRVQTDPGIMVDVEPDNPGPGVILYHLSDIAVLDNNVLDAKDSGISVVGAADGLISGNNVKYLKDFSQGIDLESSTRLNILHSTISDCTSEGDTGHSFNDVTASRVSGNLMERNTYDFQFYSIGNFAPMMDIDGTNLADGRPIRYYEGKDHF